ncbi:MAG: RNA polymerase factor sigma-32, partial [Alphaproteobacteria bacterium]
LHELITSHMRLVVSMAVRYRGYGLPLGDLVQEGSVGLMQAALRFDVARNARFSTYATWWVRAAIQDFVLRNWSIVRTGTSAAQKTLFYNLRRLRARLGEARDGRLDHDATLAIARALEVEASDVSAMEVRLFARDLSVNAPVGENAEAEWQDLLADERPSPEETVIEHHETVARERLLAQALEQLSERERLIIRERHLKEDETTLESLGGSLGVSKERVRQIECKALEKLKRYMLARSESGGRDCGGRA